MGYLTDYTIRIVEGDGDIHAVARALNDAISYGFEVYSGEVFVSGVKWYGYEDDVREVSTEFPDLLLEVEGSGEDYPDIWAQRFRNGAASERVKATISFPGLGAPELSSA